MKDNLTKFWLGCLLIILFSPSFSQIQLCPNNINFSSSDITNWSAYTGLVNGPKVSYPAPNSGISTIPEYTISNSGIQVFTSSSTDPFGGFPTLPTVNGYQYTNSIKLGSSSNSHDFNSPINPNPGGFVRGISYSINVPAGPTLSPYTMTYAYALVLENGSHSLQSQPQFKALLKTSAGDTIQCASPKYALPTYGAIDSNGTGATLDSVQAIKLGFIRSPVYFHSFSGTSDPNGNYIYDVWTKGWTEVTFDLSPYRGQQVTLTFETDNCAPGAHFAYAYIALRNSCAGLLISGQTAVCTNNTWTYSIPELAGATYKWSVPNNWKITSDTSNIIHVIAGNGKGYIVAKEQNSCANLTDSLEVTAMAPSVGGNITGNNTVCTGSNTSNLLLNDNTGSILKWLSSIDGITWDSVSDITKNYTVKNLVATTKYKVLVQNGQLCIPDSSLGVTILVDPQSVGGILNPINTVVCEEQTKPAILNLTGQTGIVSNWIFSQNNTEWQSSIPVKIDSTFSIIGTTVPTRYRAIVKSGVCDPDTSSIANIIIYPAKFPQATVYPLDTSICYGTATPITAYITQGSNYSWSNHNSLYDTGDGTISYTPFSIKARVAPTKTSYYILSILNASCPVLLTDTILINVLPPIVVFAGNDTSVVGNQPLQLQASVNNNSSVYTWLWTPGAGLDNILIANPLATLSNTVDSVRYVVRATNIAGCYDEDDIVVHVFKTGAEIFVPSAFTPNGDGKNDILKPIPVGITKLDFFRVYNRWGQLIYSTSIVGNGWDGTLNGTQQPSGAYVYITQGADYKGISVLRKGTVVLIR